MTQDPFSNPSPVMDRSDPFAIPSDSGRATRTGDAEDRAPVPRDQWDRYLMPNPGGGKPIGRTRVSTNKAALSNTFGIQKWSGRRTVHGLGRDPELVEQALRAAAMPDGPEQEKAFGRIAEAAFKVGGGKERSGLGTEMHEIFEEKTKGTLIPEAVDAKWTPELTALEQLLEANQVELLPEFLERQVLCPFDQAGTFDNIVRWWNPDTEEHEMVVADLKTGRTLDLGWLEILIQLWSYANAYYLWTTTKVIRGDPKDPAKITDIEGYYEDMPRELRTDRALIFHVPLDGTATLYVLDLSGVERYVKAAVEARRANHEAKLKVRQVGHFRPETFITEQQFQNVADGVADAKAIAFSGATVATAAQPGAPVQRVPLKPTAQQQADAAKAAERQAAAAKVLANAKPGEMPGDATPVVDPVTGRKKRTCGVCHKPGHQRKTCPQNPDSPNYQKPEPLAEDAAIRAATLEVVAQLGQPVPAGEPAPENNCDHLGDGDWHPYVPGLCPYKPARLIATEATPNGQAEPPYCTLPHVHQWSSSHPEAPGQWVCSVSGKPGRQAWEAGTTAVTREPPLYGAPSDTPPQVLAADHADGDDAPPPPATWPAPSAPPDMVAWGIDQAPNRAALLAHRSQSIGIGAWTAAHERAGRVKFGELPE